MLSTKGGMDIEAVAEEDPDAIATLHVDPLLGFQDFHGRRLAFDGRRRRPTWCARSARCSAKLYEAFVAEDAMLVEVNPLIVTPERKLRALDAKVTLDDNALFRHPENATLRNPSRGGPAGADGQGARADLRQARRRHRHPRQRRRARHVDARRRRPGRRRRRPTSSTPAAARRPTRSSARSRSSCPTRRSRRCCSTSSAASRAATRWRKGLIEAFEQVKPRGAVRRAPGRHERRGGSPPAGRGGPARPVRRGDDARRRRARGRAASGSKVGA